MKIKEFLKKKKINISFNTYFITAMGAMAQGLFASLLIGAIIGTIADWTALSALKEIAVFAKNEFVIGATIGVAVASALKAEGLVLYSSAVVGAIGYAITTDGISFTAGPAGSFIAVIFACEIGKLVFKETKVDILITPTVTIISGYAISWLLCPWIAYGMKYLGDFINTATEMHPFVMGIIVSVVVGIVLTLPISSAAICAMIGITGLAGGAATVGCCCQMVGFAVMSYRANKFHGFVAQGLGTSMLQMGNIIKKPIVWLPTILSSAVLGPISTILFKMTNNGLYAGMGTCGLVGPIGVISNNDTDSTMFWVGMILLCFVLPAVVTLIFSEIMKKFGWIKDEDLKLDL